MSIIFLWLEFISRELLLFSAICFLIGAIDDFLVDIIWCVRRLYRWARYYRYEKPMRVNDLPPPQRSGKIAVFVPAWQEAEVIGAMLVRCHDVWKHNAEYEIYVGCYPNDRETIAVVRAATQQNHQINLVLCANNGPTTKADCLNHLWTAMTRNELVGGYKIKAVVLHDAEDMVDAGELKIFSRLIENCVAVQLPVIPVRVHGSRWISGHYCDEFAEAHGKSLVVREALGVPLPLAGVGCAIERNILGRIALANNGQPFDIASLTEDYELGLKIGQRGGRTILARIQDDERNLIGTRACFPDTLEASVKQKARWVLGISLTGWDRLGWRNSMWENWMILRDRKAVFAALVLTIAYISIAIFGLLAIGQIAGFYDPKPLPDMIYALLLLNAVFLIWRLFIRAVFVGKLYGFTEALFSFPRVIIANIIAVMAARRAVAHYIRYCFGADLRWDKTAHRHFPETSRHG